MPVRCELITIRSARIALASSRISRSTIPWRTTVEIWSETRPLSLATMTMASSAEARCWASKSGGTYSDSITGVIGSTLIRRIAPPDSFAIITAVAMAGLASSTSVRSIGTRMRRYMAGPRLLAASRRSVRRGGDRARTDEALQSSGLGVQLRPVVERQIDDHQAGCRQFFSDAFARVDVARCDQLHRDIVEARI